VSATSVDAVVSIEDMTFTGKGIHAQKLLQAGGDSYGRSLIYLKGKRYEKLQVEKTCITSPGLLCKYVLHVVLPGVVSPSDVKAATVEVLKSVERVRYETIAMPILDHDASRGKLQVCGEMLSGMENHFTENPSSRITRIEVLCLDSRERNAYIRAMKTREFLWKRLETKI